MDNSVAELSTERSSAHLRALLEIALFEYSDRIAVRDPYFVTTATFAKLSRQSAIVANRISSSSGTVALYFYPSCSYLVAVLAVVRLGRPFLAINPKLPHQDQHRMIVDTGACLVLHSTSCSSNCRTSLIKSLAVEDLVRNYSWDTEPRWSISDQPIMCTLYTSGSTDTPKAVQIPYSAVLNLLSWHWTRVPFAAGESVALKTGIGFVDSIAELWAPLLKGVHVVIIPDFIVHDKGDMFNALQRSGVTRITLSPTLLRTILDEMGSLPGPENVKLTTVISTGEELPLKMCEIFFQLMPQCQLYNCYGSTEVMGNVTGLRLRSFEEARAASYQGNISIGKAIDNMQLMVHNPNDDGVGEIFCAGKGLSSGYLNAADQHSSPYLSFSTAKDFDLKHEKSQENQVWFRTGDLARVHNDRLYFYGRCNDVIKIAGNKIDPRQVAWLVDEKANFRSPPVIVYSPLVGRLILLCVDDHGVDLKKLGADLTRELPPYALPVIAQGDGILLFHPISDRVDKRAMLARFENKFFRKPLLAYDWRNMSHLEDAYLQKLKIFVGILGQEKIRSTSLKKLLESNYFAARGTSLNMVSFISRLRSAGMNIQMEDFVAAESLQELFDKMMREESDRPIVVSSRWTVRPLDHGTTAVAWEMVASNMVNTAPISYLWEGFPNSEEIRKSCYDESLLIMREAEALLLQEPCLSFGVFDADGSLVGVCCNYASNGISQNLPGDGFITKYMNFISKLEAPMISELHEQGHAGTHMEKVIAVIDRERLHDPALRVKCMHFIEEELIKVGRQNSMSYIMTTNTNQMARDIASLLGYKSSKVTNGFVEWTDDEGKSFAPSGTSDFDLQPGYLILN